MFRMSRLHRRQRSRGQGIVEFALILPVLILMLLITLDFGRLFMSYITLTNTTRVAANYGSVNPGMFTGTPNTTTYNAVVARESAGLNCALKPDAGGNNPPIPTFPGALGSGLGGTSLVAMTCNFSLLTPFMTNFFGGPLPISAKAEFPIRTGAVANISGTTTLPPPGSPIAAFNFTGVSGGTIDGAGNVSGTGSVTVNVNNTSANAQTWDWDWNDPPTPHDVVSTPPAHTFSNPGTYTVTLLVTNPVGSSTVSRTVTVTPAGPPPPVAGFYGTPLPAAPKYTEGGGAVGTPIRGSLPLIVDFTNQSTNGTAYSWDFGDGTPADTQTAPQHTFANLGVFTVTLTVTTPTGGTPMTRVGYITTGCVVPNFGQTSTAAAQSTWTTAGFTGTIFYDPQQGNGGPSTTPPNPSANINKQSMNGGDFIPATRATSSSPWICAGDITLRYK
jgi:PKD repeat protein